MDIIRDLRLLENNLNRLKLDYEKYFAGVLKREPLALLQDVDSMIKRYSRGLIQNTFLRFRFNTLATSFNSYRQLWKRLLITKEQKELEGEKPSDLSENKDVLIEEEKLQTAYLELLKARKMCNQPVDKITYAGMVNILTDRIQKLKKNQSFSSVNIKVEIKEGKTKIVIIPERS